MSTDIDPKTIEVWAGLREQTSRESTLQDEIDDLRAQLSGYDGFRDFLRSQDGFGTFESNLADISTDVAEISADDVAETVTFLESTFADFDTYRGDETNGALAQPTYDDYRAYLLDNGADAVDADQHIQLLKAVFDPDSAFASDVSSTTDWESLETTLVDNGVDSDSAAETVDTLKTVFPSVSAFDRRILAEDSWSDVESYLANNGLSSSTASDVVADLKTAYGDPLDETVKDQLSAIDSYDQLEQYFLDQGLSEERAATTIEKIQSAFDSFATFRAEILSSATGLSDVLSSVEQADDSGNLAAGLKIFEEPGTTVNGADAPAGAVSIRGTEIHLSRLADPGTAPAPATDISYSNISLTTPSGLTQIDTSETAVASATLTNENDTQPVIGLTVPLKVNGSAIRAKQDIEIPAGESRTVAFTLSGATIGHGAYELQIGSSGTVILSVIPEGIA